jgi:isoleucyl-tRNA synthetase
VSRVNREMEGYFLYDVVPPLISFVDDLTNWYIRRSRRRFWRQRNAGSPEVERDTLAAFATLYEVLVAFAKVMAPVLPFITEFLYQALVVDQAAPGEAPPRSVHHCDYPEADAALIDEDLERQMTLVRGVVGLGRGLRRAHAVRVRQPLPSLIVVSHDPAVRAAVDAHAELISDELNVKLVATSEDERAHAHLSAKPNYRRLGPRLGPRMKDLTAAIESLDEAALARLLGGERLAVAGEDLSLEDVVVARRPRPGVVVAAGDRWSVALDTTVTSELAREVVKVIQGLRRSTGLEVSDRITLSWASASPRVAEAMAEHGEWLAGEVLAVVLTPAPPGSGTPFEVDGETIEISIARS